MFAVGFILAVLLAGVATATPLIKRQGGPSARVVTECVKPNTVALTFDDGPWIYLQDISKTLLANNATGTFFFNGNNWGCIYDRDEASRVLYAYQQGHQIASHTWSHSDLSTLTWDQTDPVFLSDNAVHDEMYRVEEALVKIAGVKPAFMRPPFGNYNDLVLQASYIRGQVVAIWDFDDGDSTGASVAESEADYDAVVGDHPGTILTLNHETYDTTAHEVLPYAIKKLKAAGYNLVSISECTGLPAYQSVGSPGTRDSTWQC